MLTSPVVPQTTSFQPSRTLEGALGVAPWRGNAQFRPQQIMRTDSLKCSLFLHIHSSRILDCDKWSSSRSPWRARSRLRVLPGTPTTPRLLLPTLVPKKVDQGANWNGRTLRPSIAHLPAAVPQYNNKRVTLAPFTPSFVHGQSQTMEMRVCLGFRFHSYFFWYNNCHCCISHSLLYIDLWSYFCGRHNVLAYCCWLLTYYIFTMMIHKKGYASI